MKKFITAIFLLFTTDICYAQPFAGELRWDRWDHTVVPTKGTRTIVPQREAIFYADELVLQTLLFSLPKDRALAQRVSLPTPEGSSRDFFLWEESMMEPGLAEKYPQIKTFSGYQAGKKGVTVKLDYTEFGFHAMVFDDAGVYFIDPYSNLNDGFYSAYYKRDYSRSVGSFMHCEVNDDPTLVTELAEQGAVQLRTSGTVLRTFRLALACTGEYAVAVAGVNPTKAGVLSKMVTTMNRVNGVYEREVAVHMNLIANNDTLIFLDGTTDPFSNNNSGSTLLNEIQGVVDPRIGTANYDMGHVFSTGGGGVAMLQSVCSSNQKARGVTGQSNPVGDAFDIDYVAHEMGHQFGGQHTFNANTGSCNGNGSSSSAYEPGAGTTIMAYAGICGAIDNLQPHSDPYFHARSLEQINSFLVSANGATCASTSTLNNTPPALPSFTASYTIPMLTPFELSAPAVTDTDHDTLSYCWEQWNRGDYRTSWNAASTKGPIFRSYSPAATGLRVFPRLDTLLAGYTSYKGEKLPDVARFLSFKLTVRDIFNGYGSFNFPNDTIHLDVTGNGPFAVTSPLAAANWLGSTQEVVTWDVAGTDIAPVNCTNVDILLSIDGGYTYPYVLDTNTLNDGVDTVLIPNIPTTVSTARVKVMSRGNVFFNINDGDFIITHNTGISNVAWQNGLRVFPVPATNMLHVMTSSDQELQLEALNAVGQCVYKNSIRRKQDIPVVTWARGVYYLRVTDVRTGDRIVRPVTLN